MTLTLKEKKERPRQPVLDSTADQTEESKQLGAEVIGRECRSLPVVRLEKRVKIQGQMTYSLNQVNNDRCDMEKENQRRKQDMDGWIENNCCGYEGDGVDSGGTGKKKIGPLEKGHGNIPVSFL